MSFVSWQFAALLAVVVPLYWALPWRGRIWLLLAGSYLFYGVWDSRFLALILTSTLIDFYCGLGMAGRREGWLKIFSLGALPGAWLLLGGWLRPQAAVENWVLGVAGLFPVLFVAAYELLWRLPEPKQRRAFLLLSIFTNLGVLFFFKYFNFFAGAATALLTELGFTPGWTLLHVILPVGISFYTFQSISYSVSVYRGQTPATDDLPVFATYLAFFPQLVAGPIERSADLLPQVQRPAPWQVEHLHGGLTLLLVGFFKKVFVADNCALLANYAFDTHTALNGWWAVLGVLAFAFQIYGDFSGYTDIARGSAQLLGVHLSRNFAFPYFARTPSEFWQRWHMTLSAWFRDYVYIPLGGNRRGLALTLRNLWIAMLLAGLWHGASWTFVLWGAYHAALLSLYRLTPALNALDTDGGTKSAWRATAGVLFMFGLTLIGWVIFRSRDLAQLTHWFTALGHWGTAGLPAAGKPFLWLLLHVAPLLLLQLATRRARDETRFEHLPWPARAAVFAGLVLLTVTTVSQNNEFIYFQF